MSCLDSCKQEEVGRGGEVCRHQKWYMVYESAESELPDYKYHHDGVFKCDWSAGMIQLINCPTDQLVTWTIFMFCLSCQDASLSPYKM